MLAMLRFRKLLSEADAYVSSSSDSFRPANRDRPSWMNRHFSSAFSPGTRLVVAIAPALTIGFVLPSRLHSMPANELNGRPVLLTPSLSRAASGPIRSQTSANKNGFDTLMMVKPYSASPAEQIKPSVLTT